MLLLQVMMSLFTFSSRNKKISFLTCLRKNLFCAGSIVTYLYLYRSAFIIYFPQNCLAYTCIPEMDEACIVTERVSNKWRNEIVIVTGQNLILFVTWKKYDFKYFNLLTYCGNILFRNFFNQLGILWIMEENLTTTQYI